MPQPSEEAKNRRMAEDKDKTFMNILERWIHLGPKRVLRLYDHYERRRYMRRRQFDLMWMSGILLICYFGFYFIHNDSSYYFAQPVILCLLMWVVMVGTVDAKRFVGCGRTYCCNYSMEVMGI